MARTQKTNAQFDTLLGTAVPAPWAPWTRVGDVADLDYNSDMPVECSAFSGAVTFFVSYDTLNSPALLQNFIEDTFGIDYAIWKIKLLCEVIAAHAADIAPPLATDAEEKSLLRALRLFPPLMATLPFKANNEFDESVNIVADFTFADDPDVDFNQTITGDYFWWLWDFGDGTTSIANDPEHTYATNGAKTVRLIVVGPGGIVEVRKTVTVAGA